MAISVGQFKNGRVMREVPDLPVEVPADVVWWKIRSRSNSLAMIYLRRGSKFEKWVLAEKDGKLIPGYQMAENRSMQKAA